MRQAVRVFMIVILVGIIALIVYTGLRRGGPNRFEAAFNPGGKVSLDLSAGGYTIQGTTENQIRVVIDSHEGRDVQCRMTVSGNSAKVQLEGPSNNFHATIYVPQRTDLEVDQTIGDLVVFNVEGNKNLGLNIGELKVELPSNAPRPKFDGSILIGDLKAKAWAVEKGGFFRTFYASSSGPYTIKAHVDIGDLEVFDSNTNAGQSHAQKPGDADDDMSDKHSEDETE